MSQFAHCDITHWPLVLITLGECPRDNEDFEAYLSIFDVLYEKKEKFCLVIDARNVGWVYPSYIFKQAMHMMNKEAQTKAYVHRIALLITTPIAKNLLNLLFSIRTPTKPTEIFENLDTATRWAWQEFVPLRIADNQSRTRLIQNTQHNV